jgi:hypothetical protein
MAIVSKADILSFLGLEDTDNYDLGTQNPAVLAEAMHLGVESWIQNYCNRNFETTTYKERYDGKGNSVLVLNQYPVTSVTRLSLWPVDVIMVKNTNTSTNATISCTASDVILNHDGTLTSLLRATYTTFSTMIGAINAAGDGWVAQLVSPSYSNFKTTELIEKFGLYCLESNWAYLQMPYQRGEGDFDVETDKGLIRLIGVSPDPGTGLTGVFPEGRRNIFVDYTAGYTNDNMPEDLKMAVKILTKYFVQKKDEEAFGAATYSAGGVSVTFESNLPKEVMFILNKYRRVATLGY